MEPQGEDGFGSLTKENRKKISSFLDYYVAHTAIPDVAVPKHLSNSNKALESQQRSNFIYIRSLGKVLPMVESIFGRSLDGDEIGFISEELKRNLQKKGLWDGSLDQA